MFLLICVFCAASIGLILSGLLKPKKETRLLDKKNILQRRQSREPFFLAGALKPLNKIFLNKTGEALRQKLKAAETALLPEEFVLIQEALILGLPLFLYIIVAGAVEPVWLFLTAGFGFILPHIYINKRISSRKAKILKELPDVLDKLSLVFNAGLDFMAGLRWVIERSKPTVIGQEFAIVLQEVSMGRPREEAFKEMAKRLNIPELSSVIRTVLQGERLGTPILEIINVLSEEIRRQRFERGQRIALKAPIKILFPLIVFIMPVVAIIVGGPILIQFMQSGVPKF